MNGQAGGEDDDDPIRNISSKSRENSCCYGGARPKNKQNQVGLLNGYKHNHYDPVVNGGAVPHEAADRNDSSNESADEDEQCIYTFKGDTHDLTVFPNSFYLMHDGTNQYSNVFSPDMDFLEMDFDPGSGNNNDSDVAECGDDSCDNDDPAMFLCDNRQDIPELPLNSQLEVVSSRLEVLNSRLEDGLSDTDDTDARETCNKRRVMKDFLKTNSLSPVKLKCSGSSESNPETPHDKLCKKVGSSLVKSWSFHGSLQTGKYQHPLPCLKTRDDFEVSSSHKDASPNEVEREPLMVCGEWLGRRENNLFSPKSERCSSSANITNNPSCTTASKVMVWSESEACMKHVTQLGSSACGATAVANTLTAFGVAFTTETVLAEVRTNLREDGAAIPQYLYSRSVAGCNHEEMMRAVKQLTKGKVRSRFISLCGRPSTFRLGSWLKLWINMGAIPVLTLNPQKHCPGKMMGLSDGWRHQMVFGAGPKGIYLTNPLECITEEELWPKVSSNSELLVKRGDVVSRWGQGCDLTPLTHPRWIQYNVLGQVVNVLREERQRMAQCSNRSLTSHVRIPVEYSSGVTLFFNETASSELLSESPA